MCPTSGNNLVRNCSSEDCCKYTVATHMLVWLGPVVTSPSWLGKPWQAGRRWRWSSTPGGQLVKPHKRDGTGWKCPKSSPKRQKHSERLTVPVHENEPIDEHTDLIILKSSVVKKFNIGHCSLDICAFLLTISWSALYQYLFQGCGV